MIQMPELIPGKMYRREEVARYIALQGDGGADDYYHATNMFPRKGADKMIRNRAMISGKTVVMEYQEFPLERYRTWREAGLKKFSSSNDLERIKTIRGLLESGSPAFPVWVDKHLTELDPLPVFEGNHRLLAFFELEVPTVPVFLMKYEEWPPALTPSP
ncbi:hypothetical protein R5W24_005461 [Gemmata sp. JC717]|uniref:hypothetical protein n=1 Tax=Gemmata algarum TaxID=2975278 RepID=UPI0021BA7EFE|nr:hypothetical protein [Gemmata algarum]MDY3556298.1 hypothetical protein [Gemmata algarum]